MTIDEVLSRLERPQKAGKGWKARCPAHEDSNPSLSVGEAEGKILLYCFAGCSKGSILKALGLEMQDLFPDSSPSPAHSNGNGSRAFHPQRRIVATYDYTDEDGKLLFQSVRYEPKGFAQRRPDGNGGSLWNLRDVRLVLYRLPEVLGSDGVVIVEGEKDVETLREQGLVATCNPMGAGKWRESFNESLRGKRVVIIPDNDEPGHRHARMVAESLHGITTETVIVELPGLPPGGDVTDWFASGGTVNEFENLFNRSWVFVPDNANDLTGRGLQIEFLDTVQALDVTWLAKPLIPFGFFTLLDGIEGIGKTFAMLDIAKRLTLGLPMPFNGETHAPAKVLFLSMEDSPEYVLKPRFEKMGGDCTRLAVLRGDFELSDIGFAKLEETIEAHGIRFVLIDPLFSFTGRADINSTSDVRPITDRLNRIASEYGIATVGIRHINKSKGFGDARNAGAHSVAWLQGCRSGLMVGHDVEDKSKRGIAQHKLNIAAESRTVYGFEIDQDGVFRWTGESDLSISEMLAHKSNESNEDRSALAEAVRFLREQLASGGKLKTDLDNEARGCGISSRTIDRAKKRLGIKPRKASYSGGWIWELPEDSQDSQDSQDFS